MKKVVALLVFICCSQTILAQQLKIGYANLELILVYMPESNIMNQQLKTYQQKLSETIQTKEQLYQSKFQEYRTSQQQGLNTTSLEDELIKLEQEIQKLRSESEQKLSSKRSQLLEPILKKLDSAIQEVYDEGEYDYIFNSVDGNGISIILKGPEKDDLTQIIMTKLGIKLPK